MFATDAPRPFFLGPADKALLLLAALAFLFTPLAQQPLMAQGLESEEAIDAIVGSDVKTEQKGKDEQIGRIIAAIDSTIDNAERVRKTFNLNTLEIVFLPDLGNGEGAIEQAIAEHEPEIQALQESIEGSAMFYHAIDSREILLRDIVAVEFADQENVTIFVNGDEQ